MLLRVGLGPVRVGFKAYLGLVPETIQGFV